MCSGHNIIFKHIFLLSTDTRMQMVQYGSPYRLRALIVKHFQAVAKPKRTICSHLVRVWSALQIRVSLHYAQQECKEAIQRAAKEGLCNPSFYFHNSYKDLLGSPGEAGIVNFYTCCSQCLKQEIWALTSCGFVQEALERPWCLIL